MSIWTNNVFGCAIGLALSACTNLNLGPANRSVTVLGGDMVVMPPAGYCANPSASSMTGQDTAVVLMGKCSASSAAAPALITASIGAAGSGSAVDVGPVALTSFFTSDEGRAMLASSGKHQDAIVTASEVQGDAVLLLINDRATGSYWRAILALKGRLVIVSANGVQSMALLAPNDGRALLSKTLAALRGANGQGSTGWLFAAPPAQPNPSAAVAG